MNRKQFIHKIVLGVTSFSLASTFVACRQVYQSFFHRKILTSQEEKTFSDILDDYYLSNVNCQKIGEAFCVLRPHEADTSFLLNAIHPRGFQQKNVHTLKRPKSMNFMIAQIKESMRQQIQYDFQNNQVIYIDQWLLSETEVKIAAINFLK